MASLKVIGLTLFAFSTLGTLIQGVQGLFCCKQYRNGTDCAAATSCGNGELCYNEVLMTDTGDKIHQLGCRSGSLCAGGVPIGKRGSANVLCTKCCDQSFCNIPQCNTASCSQGDPCKHGQCFMDTSGLLQCTCDIGYTGTYCDQIEVCHPNPCVHGRCVIGTSGYTCVCNHGYSGDNCQTVDPCDNLCVHGACYLDANGFGKCNCDIGYKGTNCELKDACHPNPCKHGTCQSNSSGYACKCNHGYTGSNCDKADICAQNPCLHGVCSTSVSGWHCTCDQGYNGRYCDTDIDECASSPCKHGVCYDHVNDFTCDCFKGYTGQTCDRTVGIRDCKDVLDNSVPSISHNDIYPIKIGDVKVNVRCDMVTAGGGWTILMNRETGQTDFMLSSSRYALGFGSNTGNFWIGLENMHKLTSDGRRYTLRVELTMGNGTKYYEDYDDFSIGQQPAFTLHIGSGSGTAGDSLSSHNGFGFSAYDVDRDDNHGTACSNYLQGAWWFHNCYDSCLTCPYVTANGEMTCRSMSWNSLGYCMPLKAARMMTRPMP